MFSAFYKPFLGIWRRSEPTAAEPHTMLTSPSVDALDIHAQQSGTPALVSTEIAILDQSDTSLGLALVEEIKSDFANMLKAVNEDDKEGVDTLIAKFVTPLQKQYLSYNFDRSGGKAFRMACHRGRKDLVELLLLNCCKTQQEKQTAIERAGPVGMNPLHWTCRSGSKDLLELMLSCYDTLEEKQKAIGRADSNGRNALHHACRCASKDLVEVLLAVCHPERMLDFITKQDKDGASCLFGSGRSSDAALLTIIISLEEVCELHELVAFILTVDKDGNSPIHCACEHELQETLRYFLEFLSKHAPLRADQALKCKNKHGISALDLLQQTSFGNTEFHQMVYSYTHEFYINPNAPGSALLFINTINRPKWQEELELERCLLNRMNIKIASQVLNATAKDLIDHVRNFAYRDDLGSSVWLILMTHGERDSVLQCGEHTELSLQQLIDALAAEPALEDTPKIIFSFAGRETWREDNPEEPFYLRGNNFIVTQSTGYGASAGRGRFLKQLCECLDDGVYRENKVNVLKFLENARTRTIKASRSKEIPEIRSNIRKKLHLPATSFSHDQRVADCVDDGTGEKMPVHNLVERDSVLQCGEVAVTLQKPQNVNYSDPRTTVPESIPEPNHTNCTDSVYEESLQEDSLVLHDVPAESIGMSETASSASQELQNVSWPRIPPEAPLPENLRY